MDLINWFGVFLILYIGFGLYSQGIRIIQWYKWNYLCLTLNITARRSWQWMSIVMIIRGRRHNSRAKPNHSRYPLSSLAW